MFSADCSFVVIHKVSVLTSVNAFDAKFSLSTLTDCRRVVIHKVSVLYL